jgi:hypothetical protein
MMSTTHAAVGLLLAVPLVFVAPELAVAAAIGALAGGIFPDVDLLVGVHRRTLHFPVLYWIPAGVAGAAALLAPGPLTVAVAYFFVAAAVHSASDLLGAGTEPRPWERTSNEAVYVHARGRWLRPRYLVRYDGAPEDLAVAGAASIPALVVFDGTVRTLAVALVAVSVVYVLVRKRLPEIEERYL